MRSIREIKSDPGLFAYSVRINSNNFFIIELTELSKAFLTNCCHFTCKNIQLPAFYTKMKQDVLNLWTSPTLRLTYIQNMQLSEYFIKLSVRFAALSNFKGTLCSVSFMHFLIGFWSLSLPKNMYRWSTSLLVLYNKDHHYWFPIWPFYMAEERHLN